ncbi:MAG TPA: hypothetical protein VGC39_03630 [Candidatus Methylacidiphilales bacterium]
MKPLLFAIIVGLGLMASLEMTRAQTEEVPAPQPPYIQPVPDYGHWKVTFKYKDAAPSVTVAASSVPAPAPSPSSNMPTAIETIKTGDLRGVTLTFPDGTTKEYTCQGDWALNSSAKGAQLSIASSTSLPYPYYTTGFILLDGVRINPATFKGAMKYNGTIAFHYKSGDVDVWIDPTSMLPLGAEQEGVEVSYQFLTPPPRPFPIPKDQADLMKKERDASAATRAMR